MAYCELLQAKVDDAACTKCWQDQMAELAKAYEANRLLVGEPRTITHGDCIKENVLRK